MTPVAALARACTCLANAGLNIADLLNKSLGEYAYTLIDTDSAVPEDLIGRIRKIDGVLSARVVPAVG